MNQSIDEVIDAAQSKRLSPDLIYDLLARLPNRGYLLERAPGAMLDLDYLHRLRSMAFSGCTLVDFGNKRSFLLHYLGKLVHAQYGDLQGTGAIHGLLQEVPRAEVYIVRVLPPVLLLGMAPQLGKARTTKLQSSVFKTDRLLEVLLASHFSGALVLEYLGLLSVWYVREGQLFQSQPMPPYLEGTLSLFDAPPEPSEDLLPQLGHLQKTIPQKLEPQKLQPASQAGQGVWQAAETVLNQYLGRGAGMALERIKQAAQQEDPGQVQAVIQKRLEAVLGKTAAQRFIELLKEL